MNNSIFQEGDVVYHPSEGEGTIIKIGTQAIDVQFKERVHNGWTYTHRDANKLLSFSPWSKPNHVRPLKDGVYKVAYQSYPTILARFDNRWWYVDTSFTNVIKTPAHFQDKVGGAEFLYPFQDKIDE